MNDPIYSRFEKDHLILRDELAIDRTLLANERTLLAYLRSGMALVIAGVTIIHFSQEGWFQMIGFFCIPIGLVVGIIGILRYRKMNRSISLIRRKTASDFPVESTGSESSSNTCDDLQSR
jgi:putative membrane protein